MIEKLNTHHRVSAKESFIINKKRGKGSNNSKWKSNSLGSILNQYNRKCTIEIWKINDSFDWKVRFYDSIVKDFDSLENVRFYIRNNPMNWRDDEYYG